MSADMSVLGNLCRSLYLGATRLFRMMLFVVITLISILSLTYLSKAGCGFIAPVKVVILSTNSSTNNNGEIAQPDNSLVYGTFNTVLCLILNIYHGAISIPICVVMFIYMIASTFCFKHYRNNIDSYNNNHKREFVFFVLTCSVACLSFTASIILECLMVSCGPCKDPQTQNILGKDMSLVNTLNWFATFLWIGLSGVGITTYCIFHELVKSKDSQID